MGEQAGGHTLDFELQARALVVCAGPTVGAACARPDLGPK